MDPLKSVFLLLPAVLLLVGLVLLASALWASFKRRVAIREWPRVAATVTGNLQGPGPAPRQGSHLQFAPSFEFTDLTGHRWLGQSDVYSRSQEIIGSLIEVAYNPANPAFSTQPVFLIAKGRFTAGVLLVIFGAGAITMFGSVLS